MQRLPQQSRTYNSLRNMAATETERVNQGFLPFPVAIARITKAYGTSGEVAVKLTDYFNEEKPVFIYFDGLPVPFFIDSYTKRGNNGAIVKFSTVNTYKESLSLVGKDIFISADTLDDSQLSEYFSDREKILSNILDATVLDSKGKTIGCITDYLDYPENPCIEIKLADGFRSLLSEGDDDSFAEIPFNDGLILEVDSDTNSIKMDIPQGLIQQRD